MSEARLYRKKPVPVEVIQWTGSNWHQMLAWVKWENSEDVWVTDGDNLVIPTLEGDHTAKPGDWIIKGVKGEFYPCRDDIFQETYEEVPAEEVPT